MARFVLYQGVSRYDALTVFVGELRRGLEQAGHEVALVDLAQPGFEGPLRAALNSQPQAAIGFNAVGADAAVAGKLLHEQQAVPYTAFLVDHPIYHLARLRTPLARYIVTFIDHSHVDFAKTHFPNLRAAFLAHGACDPGPLEAAERDLDVVLAGSYEDPEEVAAGWRQGTGKTTAALLEEIAERTLQDPLTPLSQHAQMAFDAHQVPMEVIDLDAYCALLMLVDRYVRSLWRARCLEALDAAGISADVYGLDWSKLRRSTRHRFRGALGFTELNQVLKRAKVVLAVGANFPNGSHERVLTAMRCGAATVTDRNAYFAAEFAADRELGLYDLVRSESAAEKVAALLADPGARESLGQAGRRAVVEKHTWQHRARELAALLDAQTP